MAFYKNFLTCIQKMFNVYSKTVQGVIERYFTCIWKIFIMSPQKVDLPQKQREESKCDNCIVGGHQNNACGKPKVLLNVDDISPHQCVL